MNAAKRSDASGESSKSNYRLGPRPKKECPVCGKMLAWTKDERSPYLHRVGDEGDHCLGSHLDWVPLEECLRWKTCDAWHQWLDLMERRIGFRETSDQRKRRQANYWKQREEWEDWKEARVDYS